MILQRVKYCLIALLFSLSANAQKWIEEDANWHNVPAVYIDDPEVCILNLSKNLECNKGSEPFSSFIQKFNNDAAFRNTRYAKTHNTCITPNEEALKYTIDIYFENGGCPIKGFAKQIESSEDYPVYDFAFWCYADKDSIVYSSFINATGIGNIILFERINGKWYCTDNFPTSALMDLL